MNPVRQQLEILRQQYGVFLSGLYMGWPEGMTRRIARNIARELAREAKKEAK